MPRGSHYWPRRRTPEPLVVRPGPCGREPATRDGSVQRVRPRRSWRSSRSAWGTSTVKEWIPASLRAVSAVITAHATGASGQPLSATVSTVDSVLETSARLWRGPAVHSPNGSAQRRGPCAATWTACAPRLRHSKRLRHAAATGWRPAPRPVPRHCDTPSNDRKSIGVSLVAPTLRQVDACASRHCEGASRKLTGLGASPQKTRPSDQVPRRHPRTSRPLKPAQIDALIAGYEAGKTMKDLAVEFGINRLTVSAHLRRAGVPLRRSGLDTEQTAEAARLYDAGWSSMKLAERFGVSVGHCSHRLAPRRSCHSASPRRPAQPTGSSVRRGRDLPGEGGWTARIHTSAPLVHPARVWCCVVDQG